jgi:hypothetical protein
MKKTPFLLLLLALFLALSACAPAADEAPAVPTSVAGEYLSTEYADAASLRNQLAFGTLQLEDTENAVTSEQAQKLVPFWQAIITLSGDTTTADEELIAVQDQIVQTLTDEQLQAIADMQLTIADLDAFYAEYGIIFPTPVPGVTKVPGAGSSMSAEDKAATQTAAEAAGIVAGTGSSTGKAAKTLLFEKVIELLQSK